MSRRISTLFFLLTAAQILTALPPTQAEDVKPVAATIASTLGTSERQVRQLAFDGKPGTFYASDRDAGPDDALTLRFEAPVAIRSVVATTGRPDGGGKLEAGTIEASVDGIAFEPIATITKGEGKAETPAKPYRAIRIRPTGEAKGPLVVSELAVVSDPPLATFAYPVEFRVVADDAPELKAWAEEVAATCEAWYPKINATLASPGFMPPRRVTITLSNDYKGVAAASGDRIVGSVAYYKTHQADRGSMIHETTHVIQQYRSRNNPGWLVEGIADFVRFHQFEPGTAGRTNPRRAKYTDSYRTTASFLAYLAETYDKEIVTKLNAILREGRYKPEVFQEITGKPLDELDKGWHEWLEKQPAGK